MTDLKTALAGLRVGDYVKATGTDTRGHDVTRVGVLLAQPKEVTAQRNGVKAKAWRVFVGPEGTDPAARSTWTTLFPGSGTIEPAEEPKADDWQNMPLRLVPGVRTGNEDLRIRYGGKGGKRSTAPTEDTTVTIRNAGGGKYELRDVETGSAVLTCAFGTQIWWAPALKGDRQQAMVRKSAPLPEAEPGMLPDPDAEPEVPAAASGEKPAGPRHCILLRCDATGEELPYIEHKTEAYSLHDAIAGAGASAAARGWGRRHTRVVEAVTWTPGESSGTEKTNPPLIGLAGAARAGKDTAAEALTYEFDWQRRAFADKVREFLYALNPLVSDPVRTEWQRPLRLIVDEYGWERAKAGSPLLRSYFQRCGTDAGRQVLGQDVWVEALFRDYETWGPTVITDVRFPNEADEIRRRGGVVVEIVRPGEPPIRESGHISENALVGYDFNATLVNDGHPMRLRQQLATYADAMGLLERDPLKG
ncbi:hypothetical protein [Streptomyces sp. NPDC006134]|uniref:deoxynucleotide monophosphate kinase family protein n=1 Tax=Streptomyces sp. NPDC006134 TaxID=3154467 RepID=UPI0033FB5533